ncbi:hypothetical protein AAG906_036818 [Vitis piasezkii]
MHSEFEMSLMGELNFFLGLQIKQLKEETFINQAKYIRDLLKRFNKGEAKTMKTPMSSSIKLDKDEKGKSIDSTMYRGMIEEDQKMRKCAKKKKVKSLTMLTKRSTGPRPVDRLWIGFFGRLEARVSDLVSFLHFHAPRVSVVSVSLSTSHYSLVFSSTWLLDESRLPLGHWARAYTTHVLPYGRFLTKVFKDVGIDLSRETDFEAPSAYDTYDDQSMGQMKFEKVPDTGSSTQSSFTEPSSRPAFTEPPYTKIPPLIRLMVA